MSDEAGQELLTLACQIEAFFEIKPWSEHDVAREIIAQLRDEATANRPDCSSMPFGEVFPLARVASAEEARSSVVSLWNARAVAGVAERAYREWALDVFDIVGPTGEQTVFDLLYRVIPNEAREYSTWPPAPALRHLLDRRGFNCRKHFEGGDRDPDRHTQ